MVKHMDLDQLWKLLAEGEPNPQALAHKQEIIRKWLKRGDGVAIYENSEIGGPQCGHRKFVSYGSANAQLEGQNPPSRLPDMGGEINWRYSLVGTVRNS